MLSLLAVNKTSISSQFLTRGGNRNVAVINAVKLTKNDPEAIKKREELSKRIADTKKKLQSVSLKMCNVIFKTLSSIIVN